MKSVSIGSANCGDRQGKFAEAEDLLRHALAVFQELKLEHEIKKAEELLEKCKL